MVGPGFCKRSYIILSNTSAAAFKLDIIWLMCNHSYPSPHLLPHSQLQPGYEQKWGHQQFEYTAHPIDSHSCIRLQVSKKPQETLAQHNWALRVS